MNSKKRIKTVLLIISAIFIAVNIIPLFGQTTCNKSLDNYDLIIVLGNPATDKCNPLPMMRERVKKGVELFNKGIAKKILFTGSSVANNCTEADVMKNYAKSLGVPDSLIITESKALNTYQNAFYSVDYMVKNNLKRAAIVTSKFHIKRSCRIFSNYPIEYNMFSCEDPNDLPCCKLLIWKLRENVILTYHFFFGYYQSFGL